MLRNNIIDMDDVKAISKNFGHLDISMDGHWVSLLMMAEVCEVYCVRFSQRKICSRMSIKLSK